MRFASAAYGAALMALFGLLPPPTREQLELSVEAADRAGICTHTGIRTEDLLRLDTASLDVAGSFGCLRHLDTAAGPWETPVTRRAPATACATFWRWTAPAEAPSYSRCNNRLLSE